MGTDERDRDSRLAPEDDWFADVDDAPRRPRKTPTTRRAAEQPSEPQPPLLPYARRRLLALAAIAATVVLVAGGILLARALGGSDAPGEATPTTLPTGVTPPPSPTPAPASPPPPSATTPADGTTPELPPDGTYRRGDQGDSVLAIQQALTELGFDPSGVDGIFGAQTEAAVVAFQQSVDLAADGVVGRETLAALSQALAARG